MADKIKIATRLIWAIIAIAVISHVLVDLFPQWSKITIGVFNDNAYSLTDSLLFFADNVVMLLAAIAIDVFVGNIISRTLVFLCIGKILDESVSPFGIWWGEIVWDIAIVLWGVNAWYKKRK